MSERCGSKAPKTPLPAGFPVELARNHPDWKYALEPSARCELDDGHGDGTDEYDVARRHRNGGLLWWDPPIVLVGGERR